MSRDEAAPAYAPPPAVKIKRIGFDDMRAALRRMAGAISPGPR